MKLNEAIIKRNNINKKLTDILRIIQNYSTTIQDVPVKVDGKIEQFTSLLGEKAELNHKILKTNLSYKAEIENDNGAELVTLQQLYSMIANNQKIALLLDLQISSFDNMATKQESYDKKVMCHFDYEFALSQLHEVEDRIAYLRGILDQVDSNIDLIEE